MALHLSTALSFVCREEEKNMVLEFCKGCIEHQKAGNLYIYRFPETGKSLSMEKVKDKLLDWAKESFLAGRYHGLVIDKDSFPDDELEVTASTKDGLIMTARHKKYKHLR
ncbi:hypothetical protein JHK84_035913 [Glycine max]|nr:hypothetical protein JHK84_035913 [Glycine max]